ncbi:MAG: MFS transporter [Ruminococcaceae bacterium]|nr:MFS transporter [Oscillospiraceae bacterium]
MGKVQGLKEKISNVKTYWRTPMPRRYMTFKEIAAYSFGGIGAYFIIQLGSTLIVSTTNIIVSNAIGVGPKHSYIIYLLATILNIPMTGIRANMIDNTRGKGGKYRPYLLSMGIPTALIALVYVWFPYSYMYKLFPGTVLGYEKGYWIKVAVVFICNLALHFFFNFFRDAYENLIHVLSPNTQERTDVLAVKAVVYSLAPSIMNIANPIIAQIFADNNQTNLIVYRITYPIYAVIGIGLTIVVWANTKEKIVQAKTHTVQVRFMDALREVAKNKYFWIIALAGWLGFLELAYGNILLYSQSYGHTVDGARYAFAWTIIGNASLWGMLFAPFFVKRFGKKRVLITVNLMNVVCILMMLVNFRSFWWLVICIWINYLFGSVEQITTPAIQADIRDYQQYKSGERIDGMFAAVATIGNIVTLATSAVLPAVQEKFGIYEGNGYEKAFDILDTKTGQPDLLYRFMPALIIMAGIGAFLNVVPYFFYDFNEKKQKSVIRVLKVRALFEDYGNGMLDDGKLVEAIDIIKNAEEMHTKQPVSTAKQDFSDLKGREKRKAVKQAKEYNEEIDISKFVMDELNKFDTDLMKKEVKVYSDIYSGGLEKLKNINLEKTTEELKRIKSMPYETKEQKDTVKFLKAVEKRKLSCAKAIKKYFTEEDFKEPDYSLLEKYFDDEDSSALKVKTLYAELKEAKKAHDTGKVVEIKKGIADSKAAVKQAQANQKVEMDKHAYFGRAAKLYVDARRTLEQYENYKHLDEISALYDEAKLRYEAKLQAEADELLKIKAEEKAMTEKLKAEKAEKKLRKKEK